MQVLDGDAIAARVGLGRRDDARLGALLLGDGVAHAHGVVDAEPQLVLLSRRQQRQAAVAHEGAVAEERDLPRQDGRAARHRHLGVEVSLLVALGHGAHRERRIELRLVDLHALGLARRRHGDAAGDGVDGLERLRLDLGEPLLGLLGLRLGRRLGAQLVVFVPVAAPACRRGGLPRHGARGAGGRSRDRAGRRRIWLVVDRHRLQLGCRSSSAGAGGRQRQRHLVPALARTLLNAGAAHQLQLGGLRLGAGGQARVVERQP